jgi:hypothetical protein
VVKESKPTSPWSDVSVESVRNPNRIAPQTTRREPVRSDPHNGKARGSTSDLELVSISFQRDAHQLASRSDAGFGEELLQASLNRAL